MKTEKIIIYIFSIFALSTPILKAQSVIQEGLYVSALTKGAFVSIYDFTFEASIFYRFSSQKIPGFLFDETKTDVGIKNETTLERNSSSIFFESIPSRFFNIYASASLVKYFVSPALPRGFINLERYSAFDKNSIKSAKKSDNIGFEAVITPMLKVDILKFFVKDSSLILQTSVDIKYAYMDKSDYFFDYELLMIRKNNDFSYLFNGMIIFDLKPISVGVNYKLTYMQTLDIVGHALGVYIYIDYSFFERLYVNVKGNIGQYLKYPNLSGSLYLDISAKFTYRIL